MSEKLIFWNGNFTRRPRTVFGSVTLPVWNCENDTITSVSSLTYIPEKWSRIKYPHATVLSLSQRHSGWPTIPERREITWCFTVIRAANILPTHFGSCLKNWRLRSHFPMPEHHTTTLLWNHFSPCSRKRSFTAVHTDPRVNCERRSTSTFFSITKNARIPLWTTKRQSSMRTHSLENTKVLFLEYGVRISDFPLFLMLFSTVCKTDVQIRTGCLSWQILWNIKALIT